LTKRSVSLLSAGAVLLAVALAVQGTASTASARRHRHPGDVRPLGARHWIASWAASPQAAIPGSWAVQGFDRQTVRELVFASAGGTQVRVRLTNAFGRRAVSIGGATVASGSGRANLAPGAEEQLRFAGRTSVLIPAGGQVLSDPVRLAVAPLETLAVSLYLPRPTGPVTEHADAQQVSYVANGDRIDERNAGPFRPSGNAWGLLAGVEVLAPERELGTVVALGDSITDGVGSTLGAHASWPNDLARRLDAIRGPSLSVIDEGIAGNRILHDSPGYGVDALVRFQRDVVEQAGAREVIVLEGLNDLGLSQSTSPLSAPHTSVSASQIIAGYRQLIARAHAAGLAIIGATLTPFRGAHYWTPAAEAKRDAIDDWVLHSHAFDGVIDFARVLADPRQPEALDPAYDSGDHLHPNSAGYRAMADAVNLQLLLEPWSRARG
jgi:lysophospholipase L1-like esterase